MEARLGISISLEIWTSALLFALPTKSTTKFAFNQERALLPTAILHQNIANAKTKWQP